MAIFGENFGSEENPQIMILSHIPLLKSPIRTVHSSEGESGQKCESVVGIGPPHPGYVTTISCIGVDAHFLASVSVAFGYDVRLSVHLLDFESVSPANSRREQI